MALSLKLILRLRFPTYVSINRKILSYKKKFHISTERNHSIKVYQSKNLQNITYQYIVEKEQSKATGVHSKYDQMIIMYVVYITNISPLHSGRLQSIVKLYKNGIWEALPASTTKLNSLLLFKTALDWIFISMTFNIHSL